ncbi:hypothetical protein CR194_00440 [Salipaludibacillus keqinensis]|uniref:Uncharacterized protein n=1 Tax=Salipaludibacillus keqinensis TaxID=2045207 RepID=A0A323TIM3_9BACI|nr:hypothetical protein [Salipaludibacillus keqinensis]PYZ94046.1 hypothetical protein CR194_00440 [Salipaludibacillus keqinensis]
MKPLATQTYFKVQREVNSIEQKDIEYERTLYLYKDKLKTKYREFPSDKVFDMSFREMSSGEGLLFVHTSQGVFSYMVKSDPCEFIDAFKELEQKILQEKE